MKDREEREVKSDKEKRANRIKTRKTWKRNPGTQIIENKKPVDEIEDERRQIEEGLEEFEEGL